MSLAILIPLCVVAFFLVLVALGTLLGKWLKRCGRDDPPDEPGIKTNFGRRLP